MSKLEQLKEKAKGLEAKEPKRAVEIWLEVLNNQDETNPDLSIYNRIGDLYIKLRDPGLAADYYDQAVDKYAELGDRKSTRLNSSHTVISYAVFCLKKKKKKNKK